MRVALFGGSFDPVHRGHVAIARAAADEYRLDEVWFAPTGLQPHKRGGAAASWSQRMEMVSLACEADARFKPSAIDAPLQEETPNYTVDTLTTMRESLAEGSQLFNLVGADTFEYLAKWREPYRVLELAEWIVVSRPGAALRIPDGLQLNQGQLARIHLLGDIRQDVAATHLRERLAAGEGCEDLLPAAVAQYIAEHRLYGALDGVR